MRGSVHFPAWILAVVCLACGGASPADATRPVEAATPDTPLTADKPPLPPKPGPPPPPGASVDDGPVDPASPKGRYLAWLSDQGVASPNVQTWRPSGTGEWHFYWVKSTPGQKGHPAAVGPGAIVVAGAPAGWPALLASAPADELHRRVAWLHGAWGAVSPGTPHAESVQRKHPALADHLTAPTLIESDAGPTFSGWFVEPPAMTPFRLDITVQDDAATFSRTSLAELTR